jgi:vacuolar protein sorting-associated protein 54
VALTRLCSGRAAFSSRKTSTESVASPGPNPISGREKMTDAEVEGVRYKVVWSCLLLLEMVMDDVACAAHFQTLATNVVGKVAELLRLFNTRSTHLVLGAGAIHSAARLKSINAKHLAIVTQCIALVLAILPHIRAALMAQLPAKQHALLFELDKIKSDYHEHCEKILNKLVSIIGGIVEHSLAPRIANTDFEERAREVSSSLDNDPNAPVECCPFLDNVVTNTKKMHQVLLLMLPTELLRDVFSRIFAYLDHKVPSLFKTAANSGQSFSMPSTDDGKLQMIKEVEYMAKTLNGLLGVEPWNFTATKVLEQELDVSRAAQFPIPIQDVASEETLNAPECHAEKDSIGDMADTSKTQDDEAMIDGAADTSKTQDDASEQTLGAPKEYETSVTAVEGSTIKEDIDIEIEGPTIGR